MNVGLNESNAYRRSRHLCHERRSRGGLPRRACFPPRASSCRGANHTTPLEHRTTAHSGAKGRRSPASSPRQCRRASAVSNACRNSKGLPCRYGTAKVPPNTPPPMNRKPPKTNSEKSPKPGHLPRGGQALLWNFCGAVFSPKGYIPQHQAIFTEYLRSTCTAVCGPMLQLLQLTLPIVHKWAQSRPLGALVARLRLAPRVPGPGQAFGPMVRTAPAQSTYAPLARSSRGSASLVAFGEFILNLDTNIRSGEGTTLGSSN